VNFGDNEFVIIIGRGIISLYNGRDKSQNVLYLKDSNIFF